MRPYHCNFENSFARSVLGVYHPCIKSIDHWSAFWMTHSIEPREISKEYPPGAAQVLIKEKFLRFLAGKIRQGLVYGDPKALDLIEKTY